MSKRDFLVEIGTEELPPKSLFTLAQALATGIVRGLDAANVKHGEAEWFATPRRLAVRIAGVADHQPDQEIRRQGPAIANAYDASGQPTRAALGFAASCGVPLEDLQQVDGPKGRVLQFVGVKAGEPVVSLLPAIVNTALGELPIAKRMRWGSGDQEFVRPVHWIVMLFGSNVIESQILGKEAGKQSRGHRFHAPQALTISSPAKYPETLREKGRVVVDVAQRRESIRAGVTAIAESLGGTAVIEPALLDEVTALVEWPVPLAGRFDARFLDLPSEVLIATMQDHQRYFPVRSADGKLMNSFITVSNIESRDPDKVRDGNERVVRPRLADAAFFWETDRKQSLDSRREALKAVTFQGKLGSVYEKSERVAALAVQVAEIIGADVAMTRRVAQLAKCDLLTAMVGEFPELQGLMGRYYAQHDSEPADVAAAIEEQYWPRFSGDQLPVTRVGIAVALADKLDTIAGIFSIGQKPTGTRDPFGLRRAALGVLRICFERGLELDLMQLVQSAVAQQPVAAPAGTVDDIWAYLMERLRSSYLEDDSPLQITTEMFDAVVASRSQSPVDIHRRLQALVAFLALPEAQSLSAANKRIVNLLRKAPGDVSGAVDTHRLQDPAERALFDHVIATERAVNPLLARREYAAALAQLASLREDVDKFFDSVMVMADDPDVRMNRLALLVRLRGVFLQIADLSRLPG
ncbi:glycine--tRNA ligase subunit beta [Povalibacter sp.]|uniref:glycine--tRNA ligase subunit beta n=1 Tax=Povalibacter sp. TaxID=1962978 RepID=UPI002F414E76